MITSSISYTSILVPEVFIDFSPHEKAARELPTGKHESRFRRFAALTELKNRKEETSRTKEKRN